MFPSVSCAMMDTRQYGHGAGDMNAGDNSSCHHKRCLGCHSFYFLLSPVLLLCCAGVGARAHTCSHEEWPLSTVARRAGSHCAGHRTSLALGNSAPAPPVDIHRGYWVDIVDSVDTVDTREPPHRAPL